MGEQSGLGRTVVIRCDHQRGIGAEVFRYLQMPQRGLGIIAAAAGDYRHPACGLFNAEFEQPVLLIIAERRCLTRGAAGNQRAGTLFYLPIDQPPERRFIHGAVLKRGNQSRYRAGEHGLYPCNCPIGHSFSLP